MTGTTEVPATASREPVPNLEEKDYLFKQMAKWFDPAPQPGDLRAS